MVYDRMVDMVELQQVLARSGRFVLLDIDIVNLDGLNINC